MPIDTATRDVIDICRFWVCGAVCVGTSIDAMVAMVVMVAIDAMVQVQTFHHIVGRATFT